MRKIKCNKYEVFAGQKFSGIYWQEGNDGG